MEPNAPTAPVSTGDASTPVAPVVPTSGESAPTGQSTQAVQSTEPKLSPEDQAAKVEDDEWADANDEVFPGLKSTQKGNKNESAKPEEGDKKETPSSENSEDKKPNEEQGPGDDAATKGDSDGTSKAQEDPAAAERAARAQTRAYAQQVEQVRSEVKAKLFSDMPEYLQDADGDPIRSIEDVMQLTNPVTGEAFTYEAAAAWLLDNQQKFNENMERAKGHVERVADVLMDIKDQSANVESKYGEWLKANQADAQKIWAEYEKTLVVHPTAGIVIDAPVSIEWFYDQAVGPRLEAKDTPTTQVQSGETPEQKAEREAKEKQAAEAQKKVNRADRSDVFGSQQQQDNRTDEDKEWDEAAKAAFPEHFKK